MTRKTTLLMLAAVLLLIPQMLIAMGNSEKSYPDALEGEFIEIAEKLESGEINRAEALDLLHDFRRENNRPDNEDYGEMERLLLQIQSKDLTMTQAREQLRLLEECKDENSEIKLQQQERTAVQAKAENSTQTSTQTSRPSASGGSSSSNSGGGSSSGDSGKSKGK